MPFRRTDDRALCAACNAATELACRRCQRPLCPAHGTTYAFWVPTIQCFDSALCRRRQPIQGPARAPKGGDRKVRLFGIWVEPYLR